MAYIKALYLKNFRNYDEITLRFSEKFNLFFGDNGTGKTNLLEAIYFLSTGRSFRTKNLSELIQDGKDFFYLEVFFEKSEIEQKLSIYYSKNKKKVTYNGKSSNSLLSLLGHFPGVIVTPSDTQLITGTPQLKRQFIDLQLAQVDPLYIHYLVRYQRALKQRNKLLKEKKHTTIEVFENELIKNANHIFIKREELVQKIHGISSGYYSLISNKKETLDIKYLPAVPFKEGNLSQLIQKAFNKNRQREFFLGYTLVGPHRDDLLIKIQKKEAKTFASLGQKYSAALSIKFSEYDFLLEESGDKPIMSIDDFGLGLDSNRKTKLCNKLSDFGQVFLTSPQKLSLFNSCTYFQIEKGFAHLL